MKSKLYTFSIVALIGLFGSGAYFYKDYRKNSYQPKDYSTLIQSMGRPDIQAKYNLLLRAWNNGEIDMKEVMNVRKEVAESRAEKGAADWMFWEEIGPNFVGGRVRALHRDNQPGNESVMYTGSVSGGIFVSYNLAELWHGYSGNMTSLAISDITQTSDGKLFVGTGCTFESQQGTNQSSGFIGDGLFRREIDGTGNLSYTRLIGPSATTGNDWLAVNRVIAHPTDANKIYVGANHGFFVSTDAQASQPTFFNGLEVSPGIFVKATIDDLAVTFDNTTNTATIFVVAGGNVYRLKDAGGNQITIDKTISVPPGQGTLQRATIAVAPSNPDVVYLGVSSQTPNCTYGIFQSKNQGDTWVNIGAGGGTWDPYTNGDYCQGGYDNAIAVYPNDAGRILVGGVTTWAWQESKTKPGTGGWYQPASNGNFGGGLLDTNYIHADKHRFLLIDSNTIFVGSDGGVGKSLNGGRTWGQVNNGLNIVQMYSVAAAFGVEFDSIFNNGEQVMGGSQDNGTHLLGLSPRGDVSFEIYPNDGFDCHFSNIASLAFVSWQSGHVGRLNNSGAGGYFYDKELEACGETECGPFYTRIAYWEEAYSPETGDSIKLVIKNVIYKQGDTIEYASNTGGVPMKWIAPRDLNKGDSINLPDFAHSRLAFSLGDQIYICRDAANVNTVTPRWDLVADNSNSYPNGISNIFCMRFSKDGNQLFMGSTSGGIYRVDNLNKGYDSLSTDVRSDYCVLTCTKIAQVSSGMVSSLSVDPNNPENLVATIAGYGGGTSKVFRITNASSCLFGDAIVVNIHGDLPSGIPVYSSIVADHDENTVLVGTEFGVYGVANAFQSAPYNWTRSYGLPQVPTYAMVQQTNKYLYGEGNLPELINAHHRKVYIGTHGRGLWRSTSLVGLDEKEKDTKPVAAKESTIQFKLYPNPLRGMGVMEVEMSNKGQARIEIYDLSGKLISVVKNGPLAAGKNKISFNSDQMENGTYLAVLKSGEEVKVSKFVVVQ